MIKSLRVAIIGWGYWGPRIARNISSLVDTSVTIIADTDPQRLTAAARQHPWASTTTDITDVFISDVAAVIIATPARTHYALAKEALLHGKHVLVEKPLTTGTAEAEELVALARENGLILMVGHTFEYSPAVNELRRIVQSGKLGRIYCVETERVNLGLFRNDINVIWDLAPHDVSILLYLFQRLPRRIRVQAHAHIQPAIADVAHIDLEFDGLMSAHIHVSWLHPCKIRRVTIIGSERMVIYDDTNPEEMIKIYNKGANVNADPVVSYRYSATTVPRIDRVEPLRLECEDFVHAIITGQPPRASGEVGLAVVRIIERVQESLRWLNQSFSTVD